MKLLLVTFGVVSRIAFEFGVPVVCWIAWGWQVGVAVCLWYLLWTWVGTVLLQNEIRNMKESNVVPEFLRAVKEQYDKEMQEKIDRENKN